VAETVGVRVSVVEPGAVASEFVPNIGLSTAAMVAEAGPYAPALAAYLARSGSSFAKAQSSRSAAAEIVAVLTADEPPLRAQTSEGARAFVGASLADLDGSAVLGLTRAWVAG